MRQVKIVLSQANNSFRQSENSVLAKVKLVLSQTNNSFALSENSFGKGARRRKWVLTVKLGSGGWPRPHCSPSFCIFLYMLFCVFLCVFVLLHVCIFVCLGSGWPRPNCSPSLGRIRFPLFANTPTNHHQHLRGYDLMIRQKSSNLKTKYVLGGSDSVIPQAATLT